MTHKKTQSDRIRPVDLFHTPKSWDEIMKWINLHNPEDRPHLITAAMMTWNLACSLTKPRESGS